MKVAQADTASPKVVAVDITLGFTAPETKTVQTLKLHVVLPHDPDKTIAETEQDAYAQARSLLRAAADLCTKRTAADLVEASEAQLIVTRTDE